MPIEDWSSAPPYPNTPEGEIRMFGLMAKTLRHRSRRRRKALTILACTLLGTVLIVAVSLL